MKNSLFISIALLFVVAAGQFDAAQTARKDCGLDTPIYSAMHDTLYQAWYRGDGGNARWNPSFPSIPGIYWSADFWHTMKFGWISCYAASIATLSCLLFAGWKRRLVAWSLVFILAYGCEGDSFRFGYHNFYRNDPKPSIIELILDFNPFHNTH